MFRVFAALAICMFAFAGKGDVLLWTVSENATVDGTTNLYTFMSPIPDDDLHNPAGRVKVSGGSQTKPIYLDNWVQDLETNPYYLDEGSGYFGVWIGDSGSGHYSIMY